MPTRLRATIDKAKADPNDPTLKFIGTLIIGKKDIEVSFELSGATELGGDLTHAFEASGTIEIVKLVSSATLNRMRKFASQIDCETIQSLI